MGIGFRCVVLFVSYLWSRVLVLFIIGVMFYRVLLRLKVISCRLFMGCCFYWCCFCVWCGDGCGCRLRLGVGSLGGYRFGLW